LVLLAFVLIFCINIFALSRGSGKLATEKRIVPEFQSIELSGIGNMYIRQGNEQSLEITTDANLIKELDTNVVNGKLRIGFRPGVTDVTQLDLNISVKELNETIISGSGNIQGKGVVNTNRFYSKINGSGNITLELQAKYVNCKIAGSGYINLAGKTIEQEVMIDGSGNYHGLNLKSDNTVVTINGSGNVAIYATSNLKATINGSGSVEYKGRPAINYLNHGAGRIYQAF